MKKNDKEKSENKDFYDKLDKIRSHPQIKEIFELVDIFYKTGSDAEKLAEYFNTCYFKTFSGNETWTKEEVLKVVEVVKNNRFLYWRIITDNCYQ